METFLSLTTNIDTNSLQCNKSVNHKTNVEMNCVVLEEEITWLTWFPMATELLVFRFKCPNRADIMKPVMLVWDNWTIKTKLKFTDVGKCEWYDIELKRWTGAIETEKLE